MLTDVKQSTVSSSKNHRWCWQKVIGFWLTENLRTVFSFIVDARFWKEHKRSMNYHSLQCFNFRNYRPDMVRFRERVQEKIGTSIFAFFLLRMRRIENDFFAELESYPMYSVYTRNVLWMNQFFGLQYSTVPYVRSTFLIISAYRKLSNPVLFVL